MTKIVSCCSHAEYEVGQKILLSMHGYVTVIGKRPAKPALMGTVYLCSVDDPNRARGEMITLSEWNARRR